MTAGFIFISHASKDDAFVKELRLALENLGLPVWVDSLRLRGGDKLAPEIDQAFIRRNTLHSCALRLLAERNGRIKVHPIIDWTDRDVYRYLTLHKLPYHPLWHQGYVSIGDVHTTRGDVHTTRRLADGMIEEETRFFGLKRECGLHEYV